MKKTSLALTIVLAAGLTACGGGSTSDSQKIKNVLNEVGTSTDKSVCTRDFTPGGLKAFESASGQSCVTGVAANAKASKPNVTNVSVSGSNATATLKGSSGGKADVTLVKQNGSWKITGLKGAGG